MTTSIDHNQIAFLIGVFGLLSIIFSVYNYFRKPQIDTEKQDALQQQAMQFEKEATERRFADIGKRLDSTFAMAKNDISHVDAKVEVMICDNNKWHLEISNKLTELNTIINERIPVRKM